MILRSVPVWLSWLKYLSWFLYGFEALLVNQWSGVLNISCPSEVNSNLPCLTTGEQVLDTLAFEKVGVESRLYSINSALFLPGKLFERYCDVGGSGSGGQDSGISSSSHEDQEETLGIAVLLFSCRCAHYLLCFVMNKPVIYSQYLTTL